MKRFTLVFTVLMIMLLAISVMADGQKYDLRLNLIKGHNYNINAIITINSEQEIMGQKLKMTQTQSNDYDFIVTDIVDKNIYSLMLKINDVQSEARIVSAAEDIDITQKLFDGLKKYLEEVQYEIKITDLGKVISVRGVEDMASGLLLAMLEEGLTYEMQQANIQMLMGMFSEDFFKVTWENYFAYIPKKPVEVGESWISEFVWMDPVPSAIKMIHTCKSVKDNEMVIEVSGETKIDEPLNLGDTLMDMDIFGVVKGEIKVDISTGWINSMYLFQEISGLLSAGLKGQEKIKIPVVMSSETRFY